MTGMELTATAPVAGYHARVRTEPSDGAGPRGGRPPGPPEYGITTLGWERIQFVIELRPLAGAAFGPSAFRLERRRPGDRRSMSPTRGTLDGESIRLRFNVMQGPRQRPLPQGRWILTISPSGGPGTPVRIVDPRAVDPDRDGRAFRFGDRTYRVRPTVRARDQAFILEIRIETALPSLPRSGGLSPASLVAQAAGRARTLLFRALFLACKAVTRRNGRRILFTSDSRAELSGNLKLVHDRMVERGLDSQFEILTLFKENVTVGRGLRDRLRMPLLFASADIIVIDDYQPVIYRIDVDPDVRIIQLWHAFGSFKTVGYSRIGRPGGPNPYAKVHKNYTYAIVASEHDVPHYAEAFGIPEERVIPTGIPRMDDFLDERQRAARRAAALAAFPAIEGRRTILYAPTFRGDSVRTAHFDMTRLDLAALHALCVERDAVVVVRMHPFVRDRIDIPTEFGDRIIDGSSVRIDANDLLHSVDLLITDYSSIVYEFSTLGRPMLFYAFDLDEYVASRDFYEPYEEFVPGRIVRTFDGVLEAIRHDDYEVEKVAAFVARHLGRLDGGSTDRVIDQLILRR
jgi:CDP-ribitol ribitolphosphotransferase